MASTRSGFPAQSVEFDGRVILVTGAGSGIGFEVARSLAESGASVLATDRSQEGLDRLSAETTGALVSYAADLLDPAAHRSIVQATLDAFGGRIDGFVNCAGIYESAAIEDVSEASFDRIIGINLRGPVFLMKELKPHLSNPSAVVLIASGTSIGPTGYQGVYAASKAGVAILAASLAAELAPQGIRVNAVSPGFTDTPMIAASLEDEAMTAALTEATPDRSVGTPDDVARVVAFLLSDAARHVHGINLPVDGGFSQVTVTPALRIES